jgi:hypothetical protein
MNSGAEFFYTQVFELDRCWAPRAETFGPRALGIGLQARAFLSRQLNRKARG